MDRKDVRVGTSEVPLEWIELKVNPRELYLIMSGLRMLGGVTAAVERVARNGEVVQYLQHQRTPLVPQVEAMLADIGDFRYDDELIGEQ